MSMTAKALVHLGAGGRAAHGPPHGGSPPAQRAARRPAPRQARLAPHNGPRRAPPPEGRSRAAGLVGLSGLHAADHGRGASGASRCGPDACLDHDHGTGLRSLGRGRGRRHDDPRLRGRPQPAAHAGDRDRQDRRGSGRWSRGSHKTFPGLYAPHTYPEVDWRRLREQAGEPDWRPPFPVPGFREGAILDAPPR